MRTIILAAAAILSVPTIAAAQSTPAATTAAHYSSASTNIGDLLDDPAAKAVLDKYIPGMTTNEQVDMARGMTLKDIQQYSPDKITDKVLADIDAEFAKMPAKPTAKAPAAGK